MATAGARWTWAAMRADCVLLEDADILVVNKPPGISVMGERHDDDIVELADRAGEQLFPVHRIDKITSGVVLLAKNVAAHSPLTRQFADRSVTKAYLAVVEGVRLPDHWTIDLPLSIGRKNRVRIAAQRDKITFDDAARRWSVDDEHLVHSKKNYPSVTYLHRVSEKAGRTLVVANPVTGRRHQIRVHLAWTGTPILGDPLFRTAGDDSQPARTYLHSWKLHLPAGLRAGQDIDVTAPPGDDFLRPMCSDAGAPAGSHDMLAAAVAVWQNRSSIVSHR